MQAERFQDDKQVSTGEQFNPELHDAVETSEAAAEDEGKVVEQYATGYRMGERLLRPARVKVGRATIAKGQA